MASSSSLCMCTLDVFPDLLGNRTTTTASHLNNSQHFQDKPRRTVKFPIILRFSHLAAENPTPCHPINSISTSDSTTSGVELSTATATNHRGSAYTTPLNRKHQARIKLLASLAATAKQKTPSALPLLLLPPPHLVLLPEITTCPAFRIAYQKHALGRECLICKIAQTPRGFAPCYRVRSGTLHALRQERERNKAYSTITTYSHHHYYHHYWLQLFY